MFRWLAGTKASRTEKRTNRGGTRPSALVLEELENRLLLATYFISNSGNDSNNGTSTATPWRTIDRVNLQDFNPGDTIRFQGGSTFFGGIGFDFDDNGTATNPVTLNSYGTGRATIRSGAVNGLSAYQMAGINISNLNFVGEGQNISPTDGLIFWNDLPGDVVLRRIHIDNVDISQYGWAGIALYGQNGLSGYRDVRVTNSKLHHNLAGGLGTVGPALLELSTIKVIHDVYIGHVEAYSNAGYALVPAEGRGGSGIVLGSVENGIIERCLVHDNGSDNGVRTGTGNAGIMVYNSNNVTVQFNEIYRTRTVDFDGGAIDFDLATTNSIMQYNYSHNNDGFGFMVLGYPEERPRFFNTNIIVRYNVSENDARTNWGSFLIYATTGMQIYNNTAYLANAPLNPNATTMLIWGDLTNIRIRNNIFQTTGGMRLIYTVNPFFDDVVFQDNAYWSGATPSSFRIYWSGTDYTSLAAFRSATNNEKIGATPVGHQVNPQLTAPGQGGTIGNADLLHNLNAYKLKTSSPLRDAGQNMQTAFGVNPGTRDYYGTSLTGVTAFSIGAHEF